jgi:adenylate cyclase
VTLPAEGRRILALVGVEIERKFIVDTLPGADQLGPGRRLQQGYLAEEDDVEVRIRIADGSAGLTVKAGRGLSRTEVEVPLDPDAAQALWPHTAGRRIEKTRYRPRVGSTVADVDVYGGDLSGLRIAEVEFSSEAEAAAFQPPAWFGREVTGQREWSNAALARQGRPS